MKTIISKISVCFLFSTIFSCSSSQLKEKQKRTAYEKEVISKGNKLYEKKYKRWKCSKLESSQSKIKSSLDKILEKISENKELEDVYMSRRKKLDISLNAIEMALDTCEDDTKKDASMQGENIINNNININNNRDKR